MEQVGLAGPRALLAAARSSVWLFLLPATLYPFCPRRVHAGPHFASAIRLRIGVCLSYYLVGSVGLSRPRPPPLLV